MQAWESKYDRSLPAPDDSSPLAAPDAPTTDWKAVKLPSSFASAGLPDAGAIWFRRTLSLPPDVLKGHPPILLGEIPGFDTVYWNGVKVGGLEPGSDSIKSPRRYDLPPNTILQAGEGVLAIRIAFPASKAALPGAMKWGTLALDGDWLAKVEKELPPASAEALAAYPTPPPRPPNGKNTATYLFNGMISPLTSYTIKGAIWYQGESDADHAFQYQTSFPLMIEDWRSHWGEGDFPFYFCQLANFMPRKPTPSESTWAELREAQTKTLSVSNTGMAVLIDVGDEGNIHPHDKQTPGERLAALALANTYGKQVPYAGPTYTSMTVEGDSIRVSFAHTEGGLAAQALPAEYAPTSEKPDQKVPLVRNVPNSPLEGFALCGEDHVWKWAEAKIDGNTVVVRADGLSKPVAVRYAWADNPICNLTNSAGFPAVPFRSDDFPELTRNGKF